jgi:hypothetical protein
VVTKHGKAPSGQWEPPDPSLIHALGQFVMSWSLIESTLEIGISKQLKLDPLEASIVTAGAQFRNRAAILMSLLNRDPPANASAIKTIKNIQNISHRNDILHSVVGGSATTIWFNRRKTGDQFASKIEVYDLTRLSEAAAECTDLATTLMADLGISPDDYRMFFQEAHNAANKV